MSYSLKLGTTASIRFENAINESQALEQLKSAFPGLTRGNRKAMYRWEDDKPPVEYFEPEIKLIENT
jgi:hypothetical protein